MLRCSGKLFIKISEELYEMIKNETLNKNEKNLGFDVRHVPIVT